MNDILQLHMNLLERNPLPVQSLHRRAVLLYWRSNMRAVKVDAGDGRDTGPHACM